MRRLTLLVIVAGAVLAPATPAFAHAGDTPDATAYRTTVTAISAPEKGLTVRTVEAGARLELSNKTGHSVEVLGYSGEPYLDIRPDGTYENVNSAAAYINETLAGDTPVPLNADPTAPPSWRRLSASTTVRWHDQRTHWLSAGLPPQARADPARSHRLRDWEVPLRYEVNEFRITGTLDWEPPPRAWLWWTIAALIGLTAVGLLRKWPRSVRPLTLIVAVCPLSYAAGSALDGVSPSLPLIAVGLLALAASYRHPPFLLALAGAAVALFAGVSEAGAVSAAVLPTVFPGWLARTTVVAALGIGASLTVIGVLGIRAQAAAANRARAIVVA